MVVVIGVGGAGSGCGEWGMGCMVCKEEGVVSGCVCVCVWRGAGFASTCVDALLCEVRSA